MADLILTLAPGALGLLMLTFCWRKLPELRRGSVSAANGVDVEKRDHPALFWSFVAIWVALLLLASLLVFWSVMWIAYVVEYRK